MKVVIKDNNEFYGKMGAIIVSSGANKFNEMYNLPSFSTVCKWSSLINGNTAVVHERQDCQTNNSIWLHDGT